MKVVVQTDGEIAKAIRGLHMQMAYDKGTADYESWCEFYQDRDTGKVYITDIMQVTPPEQPST